MEEQLVSYETAKLAKEKGFNIVCKDCIYSNNEKDGFDSDRIELPSQSLLQRWLRDKHNICVVIEPTNLGDNACYVKDVYGEILHDPWKDGGIRYTYEEALEFGLQKALNIIK